ncbi:MAG: hypothetical protein J7647_30920 [Cyanobacteria bacterium SBLK]|nr:hypothetical protein [Cyanobacteria bacterium SBLK]
MSIPLKGSADDRRKRWAALLAEQLENYKSREELGRRLKVSGTTVQDYLGSGIEAGMAKTDPRLLRMKNYKAVADLFNWSLDDLYLYIETGKRPDCLDFEQEERQHGNELEEIATQAKHLSDRLQYYLTKSTSQLPVSAMHRLQAFLKQEIDRAGTQSSFEQKLQAFLLESPTKDRKALQDLIEGTWKGDRDDLTDLYFSIAYSLWNYAKTDISLDELRALAKGCDENSVIESNA